MYKATALLDEWVQENNIIVTKWKQKQNEANTLRDNQKMSFLRCLSSEFHKLLSKIQGAPPLAGITQLELTVMYNASVFSIALSEISEVELLITNVIGKVLQIPGFTPGSSDSLSFWRKVSEISQRHVEICVCIRQLFCLQWAVWLTTQRFNLIREVEGLSLFNTVPDENERRGNLSDTLLLVFETKELIELLHVCTFIGQGAEKLSDGQCSEAFCDIQKATSLPAPRALVAYTHHLLGSCFVKMKRPQMALLCFRKALETDFHCVSSLYQSMLIYRHLENRQAEIQALEILHSALMITHTSECDTEGVQLISPSLLLCSPSMKNLLTVPSALTVLHNLALKCVLHGRLSEGVEHYLDLLAAHHTDQQNPHLSVEVPSLSQLTDLYLEAAAALLMVQRPADCIALCDEVVGTTLDLLPERLVLEESDTTPATEPSDLCVNHNDRGAMVLRVGAACLLQGHCYINLKDWKQAITHYTRCIDLLVKVCFKKKGCQPQIPTTDMVDKEGSELFILQRLKGLSFAGRGICFAQTDQLKEAVRDLHLSLQAFPECVGAGLWCGEVLWRLDRRQEAASCWKKSWVFNTESSKQSVCVYLLEPPTDHLLNSSELLRRIEELDSEKDRNRNL